MQPFSDQYRLLDRLCADCEYFLGAGQRAEKHLWAGSVDAQIEKMRELYAQLPEKPDWISPDAINAYARRMAAPEPVENTAEASPEETQILDEALDAHHGQIDIRLAASSPEAQDPMKWRGQNLLGFALMEVRDELRRVTQNEMLCDWNAV